MGKGIITFKKDPGKPWLWLGIPENQHWPDPKVEDFIRNYFAVILKEQKTINSKENSIWCDIETGAKVISKELNQKDSNLAWLPSLKLLDSWKELSGF